MLFFYYLAVLWSSLWKGQLRKAILQLSWRRAYFTNFGWTQQFHVPQSLKGGRFDKKCSLSLHSSLRQNAILTLYMQDTIHLSCHALSCTKWHTRLSTVNKETGVPESYIILRCMPKVDHMPFCTRTSLHLLHRALRRLNI